MPDLAPVKILVVDDLPEKHVVYRALLDEPGQELVSAMSGEEALKALLQSEFAVILLDINMPGMDGFETASLIRARKGCAHTPIIFITAFPDEVFALKGYALGAVDYILAPVAPNILRTKVGVFVQLYRLTQQVKKQAAQQVALARDEQARLTAALDNAADFVAQADQKGRLVHVNGAGRRMLGCEKDTPAEQLLGHRDRAVLSEGLAQAERDGVWFGEAAFHHRNGVAIPVAQIILAHKNERVVVESFSIIARDIGQRKRAEEEIRTLAAERARLLESERAARAEAERLGRLKDEFLATLSHELRTPLNAILGWARLLQGPKTTPEDIAEGLEVIDRNAGVQARLVEELLDMNRIISGKLPLTTAMVDVGRIVAEALESVRLSAAARQIDISFLSPDQPIETVADGSRIQQVIWNLLTNAIKFTPKGGRVAVELEAPADVIIIRVRDSGEGIPAEFMPYVFDRFRQADAGSARRYGGLGLGLAIVKQLVDLHGGTVEAQSEGRGKGATFIVTLPRRTPASSSTPSAPSPGVGQSSDAGYTVDGRRLSGVRVLVVDDEPDAVNLARRVLEECKAEVVVAYSAAEAFHELHRLKPDVIISDIGMPTEDGYSLIQRIRQSGNGNAHRVGAVAMTAFARPEDKARALDAGYQAHVTKPVDPRELVRVVAGVVDEIANHDLSNPSEGTP